jgi:hypothetical protein
VGGGDHGIDAFGVFLGGWGVVDESVDVCAVFLEGGFVEVGVGGVEVWVVTGFRGLRGFRGFFGCVFGVDFVLGFREFIWQFDYLSCAPRIWLL